MKRKRAFSRQTLAVTQILGVAIARARRERRWKLDELAERAGISVPTLRNVERGVPTVSIGTVFEVATILGVPLFGAAPDELSSIVQSQRLQLALLPDRVRESATPLVDEF